MKKAIRLSIIVILVLYQLSCTQTETNSGWTKIVISEPTIIVVTFDSLEIENAK